MYSTNNEIYKMELQQKLEEVKFLKERTSIIVAKHELGQFDKIIKILEDYKNGNLQPVEQQQEKIDDDEEKIDDEELPWEATDDEQETDSNEQETDDEFQEDPMYRPSEIKDVPPSELNDYTLVYWVSKYGINPKFLKFNPSPGAQALMKKMVSPQEYRKYLKGCRCRTPIPTLIVQNMDYYLFRKYLLNRCVCDVDYKQSMLFATANEQLSANPTAMHILENNQDDINRDLLSTNPAIFVRINKSVTSRET